MSASTPVETPRAVASLWPLAGASFCLYSWSRAARVKVERYLFALDRALPGSGGYRLVRRREDDHVAVEAAVRGGSPCWAASTDGQMTSKSCSLRFICGRGGGGFRQRLILDQKRPPPAISATPTAGSALMIPSISIGLSFSPVE